MILSRFRSSAVATNAGWIIVCKLCKAILVLISTMVVSRHLGVERYGLISYGASIVAFVAPVMKLGINEILVNEIISYPEQEGKTVGTTIVLNLVSAALCSLGIWGFSAIVHAGETETILVCVCSSLTLIFQAAEMVFYWFQAKLKSKYTALSMLGAYVVVILAQVVFIVLRADIYLFALSHAIEYLIIAIVLLIFYKMEKAQPLSFSFDTAKRLLGNGKYYIISGLMVMIFSQTDKIMLKLICDNAEVGLYSAAATCASMTSFVFVAIIDSIRPTIFECKNNESQFEQRMRLLYSVIIWFSLVQCVIMTVASPLIIYIMYGSQYAASEGILRIVVWFTTFSYLGTVRNIWMLSKGYQKYLVWIDMAGALINVILNSMMIPLYGAIGAAVASVFSQMFTNVIMGYIIRPLRRNNRLMFEAVNPKHFINELKSFLKF